jgi:hypothetical protein
MGGEDTYVSLEFREPYISQKLARDISTTLVKAIKYLLEVPSSRASAENGIPSNRLVSDSLSRGFFKCIVGSDETSAYEYWQRQFSGIMNQFSLF